MQRSMRGSKSYPFALLYRFC
uniref:Uncharacterized protein n=1 Tax=Arundo donax TaxID=35708 RepID=A0A0A9FEU7_ARUDO